VSTLRLRSNRAFGQGIYRRRLRGRVIHVCWHFRQRNSLSSFVAFTSSNRSDPHCGQESARDRSRSGHSSLARMRRSTCCRRSALSLSRGLFIGPRTPRAKLMPSVAADRRILGAQACAVSWQKMRSILAKKRQTHVHDQAGHVRRIYRSDANSAAPRERLWRRRPSKEPPWCCRTCRRECPVTTWEHEAVEPFFIVRRWYPELNRWETALTMRSENVVGAEVLKDGVRTEYIPVPVEE